MPSLVKKQFDRLRKINNAFRAFQNNLNLTLRSVIDLKYTPSAHSASTDQAFPALFSQFIEQQHLNLAPTRQFLAEQSGRDDTSLIDHQQVPNA